MDYRFFLQLSPVRFGRPEIRDEIRVHGLAGHPEPDSFLDRIRPHGQDAPVKHQRVFRPEPSDVPPWIGPPPTADQSGAARSKRSPPQGKPHNDSTLSNIAHLQCNAYVLHYVPKNSALSSSRLLTGYSYFPAPLFNQECTRKIHSRFYPDLR